MILQPVLSPFPAHEGEGSYFANLDGMRDALSDSSDLDIDIDTQSPGECLGKIRVIKPPLLLPTLYVALLLQLYMYRYGSILSFPPIVLEVYFVNLFAST